MASFTLEDLDVKCEVNSIKKVLGRGHVKNVYGNKS